MATEHTEIRRMGKACVPITPGVQMGTSLSLLCPSPCVPCVSCLPRPFPPKQKSSKTMKKMTGSVNLGPFSGDASVLSARLSDFHGALSSTAS